MIATAAALLIATAAGVDDERLLPPPERLNFEFTFSGGAIAKATLLTSTGNGRLDDMLIQGVPRMLRLMVVEVQTPHVVRASFDLDEQGRVIDCRPLGERTETGRTFCERAVERLKPRLRVKLPKPGVVLCDYYPCLIEE